MSFDVGIKNMAYCIFSIENNVVSLKDWNVLNLMDEKEEPKKCNCIINKKNTKGTTKETKNQINMETKKEINNEKKKEKKNKKSSNEIENIPKECQHNAKYMKNESYYCEKHAKSQQDYVLYDKECSPIQLKKKKLEELKSLCNKYLITHDENNCTIQYSNKTNILNVLQNFYKNRVLEPIKEIKTKSAGETDIISIGRNMRTLLDELPHIREISHVIIENQISPIANRMKTIQGMLAQYFIMKEGECSQPIYIEFVSSFNKLKDFSHLRSNQEENMEEIGTPSEGGNHYKSNKKDSILICSQFLTQNSYLSTWIEKMNTKKKDDLADCFLQGIWYLKSKSFITYNKECSLNV
jgi:hypothetical protein